MVTNIFIDAVAPLLFYFTFSLLPLGIGFAVMASGIIVTTLLKRIIQNAIKPEKEPQPEFEEDKYEAFKTEYSVKDLSTFKNRFFNQNNNKPYDTDGTVPGMTAPSTS